MQVQPSSIIHRKKKMNCVKNLRQGCKNLVRKVGRETIFRKLAPHICESSVCSLLQINYLPLNLIFSNLSRESGSRKLSRYREWLRADSPEIESRWGTRISAPVQTDPVAHPAWYTMGTGSFPGVKRPGSGFDHSPHPSPRLTFRRLTSTIVDVPHL